MSDPTPPLMREAAAEMSAGVTVLEPGHRYFLPALDGGSGQELRFVKRGRYAPNAGSHPGVQSQSVLRSLLDRTRYVQHQAWCVENAICLGLGLLWLWLLEFRAARRRGLWYLRGLRFAECAPVCATCGHTLCRHVDRLSPGAPEEEVTDR